MIRPLVWFLRLLAEGARARAAARDYARLAALTDDALARHGLRRDEIWAHLRARHYDRPNLPEAPPAVVPTQPESTGDAHVPIRPRRPRRARPLRAPGPDT